MCGIFGLVAAKRSELDYQKCRQIVDQLFVLSESRGKEAAGLAFLIANKIEVYKSPQAATALIKSEEYEKIWQKKEDDGEIFALIGHARLVTNGSQLINSNNQPVIKEDLVAVHNGIITNVDWLWQNFTQLTRQYELDTEIILALINHFLGQGIFLEKALSETYHLIEGTASLAILMVKENKLILSTNNGSLYFCYQRDRGILIFASERNILEKLIKKELKKQFKPEEIRQLKSNTGLIIDLAGMGGDEFEFEKPQDRVGGSGKKSREVREIELKEKEEEVFLKKGEKTEIKEVFLNFVKEAQLKIDALRRCTKCILPETFPNIEFDKDGVCNYCHTYQPMKIEGEEKLKEIIEEHRQQNNQNKCLMTFSGGRDSSFGLHYIKSILGMNPVAYSYDWGMITDLGRRNQARMCGKLGVEHILVSADIKRKRDNIRKNILAWLKKPDLGTVPLFMAGDKQYFYYANKLRRQLGVDLVVLGTNPLEKTYFKTAFSGVKIDFRSKKLYTLSLINKIKLAWYYFKALIANPAYLNASLWDTLGGFISYYFIPHHHLDIYKYIKWDEELINKILKEEYNWEIAKDTQSTWRIGDGTASFYNYIYYITAGFTENDTFRSNQIRENMLTRAEALRQTQEDNRVRWESIQWYCQTIGIDLEETIRVINSMRKLY